jgi:predicted nucleic acid-binding protein
MKVSYLSLCKRGLPEKAIFCQTSVWLVKNNPIMADVMHVFLDTNIFDKDPLWKNSYSKTLLERAKSKKLSLYISAVVYEELKWHSVRNYNKNYKAYRDALYEMNRYLPENLNPLEKTDVEANFVEFYADLQDNFNVTILPSRNELLPTIMDRAIRRKKPFNDEKTEVKDCVIWLTYANYVESNDLPSCYLLSANSKDFYVKIQPTKEPAERKIHEDLAADSSRFRCFASIRDFFKIVIEPLIEASERLKKWLADNVHKEYVFELVSSTESATVENAINKTVSNWSLTRIFSDYEWSPTGYCQLNDLNWAECTELDFDLLDDSCIVNATIALQISVEGYAYNPVHDDHDDKYSYIGEKDVDLLVSVNFILHEGGGYDSFDIEYIEYSRD